MSERQWRILSLLERLERGEVTVGEVAASVGWSRRQVQRMRKRLAQQGAPGLVHGNAGRAPKHRTPQELREQVVMLRRGKYAGFNDQHFTEKLVEVEGLELSRETVRRILREAGIGWPRKPDGRHRRCYGGAAARRPVHRAGVHGGLSARAARHPAAQGNSPHRVRRSPQQPETQRQALDARGGVGGPAGARLPTTRRCWTYALCTTSGRSTRTTPCISTVASSTSPDDPMLATQRTRARGSS